MTPNDALEKAARILKDHLRPFLGSHAADSDIYNPISEEDMKRFKLLTQDVDVLELSARARNCLNNADIKLLGELCLKTESKMLKYRNFGKKSLDEIKAKLAQLNLSLGMTLSEELETAILAEAERAKAVKNKAGD